MKRHHVEVRKMYIQHFNGFCIIFAFFFGFLLNKDSVIGDKGHSIDIHLSFVKETHIDKYYIYIEYLCRVLLCALLFFSKREVLKICGFLPVLLLF